MFSRSKSLVWWLAAVFLMMGSAQVFASSAKPGELDLLFAETKKRFHSNGTLASVGQLGTFRIVKGKKSILKELPVGTWKSWWPNGKQQTVEEYCNGFLVKHHKCKFGQKHGVWKTWFSSGNLRSTSTYQKGHKEGTVTVYFSNGARQSLTQFSHGKAQGRFEAWWTNGKVASSGTYNNGKRTGTWKEFYSNGKLKFVKSYLNGQLHGSYVVYWSVCSPAGCFHRKMLSGAYTKGKKSGQWRYWDLQGTPTSENQWKIQYSN